MTIISSEQNNGNISAIMFDASKIELLKNTICKGATDDELQLFIHVCINTGLDPFLKQIHAIPRKVKNKAGGYDQVITIQTAIDGYRLIAERTGKYSPGKEPTFTYDQQGKLLSATAYVKKQTKDGKWHDISATAFWSEYAQTNYDGTPTKFWKQMPHGQLSKCAEALALRKAFPAELSGLYADDEMGQADNADKTTKKEIDNKDNVQCIETEVIQSDMSEQDLKEYFTNTWGSESEQFGKYFFLVKKQNKWENRKTFEHLEKNREHTMECFSTWKKKMAEKEVEKIKS